MMRRFGLVMSVMCTVLLMAGCVGDSPYADLDQFMEEKRNRPAGRIKPVPPMKAYRAFNYSASGMRSPFDRPVEVRDVQPVIVSSGVEPDIDRTKEYLEQFSLDALRMVGSMRMNRTTWALLSDSTGNVHRVKRGMYIGRNHGRIVEVTETYLALVEIVSNGGDGWIERPRTIELKTVSE